MAVQTYGEVPGMTQEMYEGMVRQLEGKLRAAPGFIAHIAGPTASGWGVTELWETQEAADAWLNGTVIPMVQAAGMPAPQVQSRPVQNLIIAGK
jgi:heme-degrading monooxygenase HmoA